LVNFLENSFQSRLWNIIQFNFDKSENLTKEILQVVEAKDCFVSSLSHEVRNIVNLLTGSVDYLLELTKNRTCLQVLKNIKMSGDILLNLVNNTLDAAKIKANKLELAFDHAEFEDIVKKALIINSERLKNKNIYAEATIDTNIPKELWIDSGRLLQIIINLLSNAIKFTPEGGRIRVAAQKVAGGRFDLIVADSGIGIPLEDQNVIFEKFRQGSNQRGNNSLTREYEGTGLGLSIVKELSKLLGGEVLLESEFGKGSTFTVRLPIELAFRNRFGDDTSPAPAGPELLRQAASLGITGQRDAG